MTEQTNVLPPSSISVLSNTIPFNTKVYPYLYITIYRRNGDSTVQILEHNIENDYIESDEDGLTADELIIKLYNKLVHDFKPEDGYEVNLSRGWRGAEWLLTNVPVL